MKIELRNISLSFAERAPLFSNLDLTINEREFVLIHGPSGCGKSSLLRILNKLINPTSGEVLYDSQLVIDAESPSIRRRVAYLQQTPVMVNETVRDNLLIGFGFRAASCGPIPSETELQGLLDEMILTDVELTDDAATLSIGQQQRVALIRTLLTEPEVLLCDEPTSALDDASRRVVEARIERTCTEDGKSVVMITHTNYRPENVNLRRLVFKPGDGLREVGP